MTTRVNIENAETSEHDVEVYTVAVDNLGGRRVSRGETKHLTLKPGAQATIYVHMCQDLRIVEKPR